jgi:uncharacterized protein YdeI (BOF family)
LIRFFIFASVATAGLSASAQAGQTIPIAQIQPGAQVTLEGVVERIPDEDEFVLADPTGAIEVYLGPNRVPVSLGESVTVTGFVDDEGVPDLCASSITRADGSVITIANCDE